MNQEIFDILNIRFSIHVQEHECLWVCPEVQKGTKHCFHTSTQQNFRKAF